jgi:hypothetical protein
MKQVIISLFIIIGGCYSAKAQTASDTTNPYVASVYAALPVLETYVPDALVSKLKDLYGAKLYDITWVKSSDNQDVYVVRTQENGVYQTQWVNADGTIKS